MDVKRLFVCLLALLAAVGCVVPQSRTPRYTSPPEIVSRASWSRRLPGGSYHAQQPSRIGFLVTSEKLKSPEEVEKYLKEQEERAWTDTRSSQVAYHFYFDGAGNIYQGRALNCESPAVAGHDPKGLVWIAFLDDDLDFYADEEFRDKIVHLVTYLCFTYDMPAASWDVECRQEVKTGRLCKDLQGSYISTRVATAIEETMKELEDNPTAYLEVRTQQLRTNPSAD